MAGNIRESPCENLMLVIGAAITPRMTKERTTAATGRFITRRAVCAQRPSSFGVIAERRTTPLSILDPIRARIAGKPTIAPTTAIATTDTPAYPNDFKNGSGKKVSENKVTSTVIPE